MKNILRILVFSLFLLAMSSMSVSAQEEINEDVNPKAIENVEEPENPEEPKNPEESEDSEEPEIPEEPEVPSIDVLKKVKITLKNGSSYAYTGKKISPAVKNISFVDENGKTKKLTEGFKITYKNNSGFGKPDATLTIDGYEGQKVMKDVFSIVMGKVSSVKKEEYSYNIIKLSWSTVKGAQGYAIYRSTKSGSYGSVIKRIESGSKKTYSDKNIKAGKTYYYRVRPYRLVNGKRIYGAYSKQVSQKAGLAKAQIISVKRSAYNYLTIEWDKVKDASGYRIYRSNSKNGTYIWIATVKDDSTFKYKNKVPVCGKNYYYKVTAYRKNNGITYLGIKSDSMDGRTTPAKISFTQENISRLDSVSLFWKKSAGAKGYEIYRSTNKSSGFECINTILKGEILKWTDNLTDETIYYYKIRPYTIVDDEKVYGSYSSVYERRDVRKLFEEVKTYTYVNYVYGGKTVNGWDCSGFTAWALKYIYGVDIPSYSSGQANFGKPVNKYDMSKWQLGDILVYSSGGRINHVALYLGDGKMMHALNSKYDTVIQEVEYYEVWDNRNNLCRVRRCF